MSFVGGTESDGLYAIEVSDLHPAPRARRGLAPSGERLSTRLRGWRFAASLLALLLLALDLTPGTRLNLAGMLAVAPASAPSARQRPRPAQPAAVDASQLAPADLNSVWPSLTGRLLRLPSVALGQPCPTTPGRAFTEGYGPGLGGGPVYLLLPGANDSTLRAETLFGLGGTSAGWSGQQVRWIVHPLYHGPVLVRGGRIDSAGALQFNGGLDQSVDASQLTTAPPLPRLRLVGDSSYGAPWIAWVTYLRVREAGCYAVQLDGLTFSETIVFRAVLSKTATPGER